MPAYREDVGEDRSPRGFVAAPDEGGMATTCRACDPAASSAACCNEADPADDDEASAPPAEKADETREWKCWSMCASAEERGEEAPTPAAKSPADTAAGCSGGGPRSHRPARSRTVATSMGMARHSLKY